MSDHASEESWQDSPDASRPNHPDRIESVEAYEEEDRVVLFDAENPLAWVETTRAVCLEEHA
jgi:hypothetical protein